MLLRAANGIKIRNARTTFHQNGCVGNLDVMGTRKKQLLRFDAVCGEAS